MWNRVAGNSPNFLVIPPLIGHVACCKGNCSNLEWRIAPHFQNPMVMTWCMIVPLNQSLVFCCVNEHCYNKSKADTSVVQIGNYLPTYDDLGRTWKPATRNCLHGCLLLLCKCSAVKCSFVVCVKQGRLDLLFGRLIRSLWAMLEVAVVKFFFLRLLFLLSLHWAVDCIFSTFCCFNQEMKGWRQFLKASASKRKKINFMMIWCSSAVPQQHRRQHTSYHRSFSVTWGYCQSDTRGRQFEGNLRGK